MSKILSIGEAIIVIKEIFNSVSELFSEFVPSNFFELMDKMAFLSLDFLGFGSNGEILDKGFIIGEAIMKLSNFLIWGLLIFYGFRSLFSYFLSKKVDVPWKMFIRIVVFGILANSAFFICYTGAFFTENCTEYMRSYAGKDNISFSVYESYINIEEVEDDNEIYTFDALISIFIYFSTFFVCICLGARYLFVKILILLSPIFFILGGFKYSEKIFFAWCKKILILFFLQFIFSIGLAIIEFANYDGDLITAILICAFNIFLCRNILKFLKLSY